MLEIGQSEQPVPVDWVPVALDLAAAVPVPEGVRRHTEKLRGLSDYVVKRKDFAFIKKLWRDWSPGWDYPEDEMEHLVEVLGQPGVLPATLGYYRAALSPGALLMGREARAAAKLSVKVPTLALTGARDGCIDSDVFQKMMYPEDFPQGLEVKQISDAGHFPHQEQPEVVNALLLEWLRKHDAN